MIVAIVGSLIVNRLVGKETSEITEIGRIRGTQVNDLLVQATQEARDSAQEAEKNVARLREDLLRNIKYQKRIVWVGFFLLVLVFLISHTWFHA